jgi:hypothetical protein
MHGIVFDKSVELSFAISGIVPMRPITSLDRTENAAGRFCYELGQKALW